MKELIKILNKYIILLIVSFLLETFWSYFIQYIIYYNYQSVLIDSYLSSYIGYIPTIIQLLIKITITVLIIIDLKKENLRHIVLTSIATFCYPLLGIVIFSILLLEKKRA